MAKKKTYNVYVNETTNEFKNTKKNEIFNVQLGETPQTIKSGKGTDTLYLKGVSSLDELTFTKEGRNLIVADKNNKQVIIQNYFTNTNGNATKSSIKKIRLDVTETSEIGTVASTKDYNILNESLINYDPVITKRSKKGLIKGTNFNDTIVGSIKADKIKGGKGDDIIYGNLGNDKLYGGAGADTFIFDTYSKENPVTGVTEFYGSGADKIYDATSVDTLQFTTSKVSDLTFTKSKKNLIIKYFDVDDENRKTTQNSVTLVNYYKQKAANRLTKIVALNQYGKLVEYNLNEVNSETFTDTNTEKPDDYAETITIGATEGETEKTLTDTTNRDQLVFEKSTFKNCNFYKKGDDLLIEYKDETVENGDTGTVTVEDYFKEDGKTKIDAFVDMNGLTHSLTDADISKLLLNGTENSDNFVVSKGDKTVEITDAKSDDVLTFNDATFDDLTITQNGNDLVFSYSDTDKVILKDYYAETTTDPMTKYVDSTGTEYDLTKTYLSAESPLALSAHSKENIFFGKEGNDLIVVCLNEDPYKRAYYDNNDFYYVKNYFNGDEVSEGVDGTFETLDAGTINITDMELREVVRYTEENSSKGQWAYELSSNNSMVFIDINDYVTINSKNSIIFDNYLPKCHYNHTGSNNIIIGLSGQDIEAESKKGMGARNSVYVIGDIGDSDILTNSIIYSNYVQSCFNSHNNAIYGTNYNDLLESAVDIAGYNTKFYGGTGDDLYALEEWNRESLNIINDISGNDVLDLLFQEDYELNVFFDVSLNTNNDVVTGKDLLFASENFSNKSTSPEYGVLIENYFTDNGNIETVKYNSGILQYDSLQTIANEVASWLTSDGRSYDSTQAVFDSNNTSDIQALLKVYADNSASAWQ